MALKSFVIVVCTQTNPNLYPENEVNLKRKIEFKNLHIFFYPE